MKRSILLLFFVSFAINATQHPMPDQTHKIDELQPIVSTKVPGGTLQYGLDLASTAAIYPELVLKDAQGHPISVNLLAFIPILIQQIQDLQEQINQNNQNQQ